MATLIEKKNRDFQSSLPMVETISLSLGEAPLRSASMRRDLAVHDAMAGSYRTNAEKLSAVLDVAYDFPAAVDASCLAIPERHYRLFVLAFAYGQWPAWFVCTCVVCDKQLDSKVSTDEFVFVPAAIEAGFPYFNVAIAGSAARYMVPNGNHEQALEKAERITGETLMQLCLVDQIAEAELTAHERAAAVVQFEEQLTVHASSFATELDFPCPHCNATTTFWFDPWKWIERFSSQCLQTIHILASAYGWSETDIIAMPKSRREYYRELVEAAS